jgi:hypothetical protein
VFEEDTYLVLSASREVKEEFTPPQGVLARVEDSFPKEPGSLIFREGDPLRILAVVHDLDREPTWKDSWVSEAFLRVFREADERGISEVLVSLFGMKRGGIPTQSFLQLLSEVMRERAQDTDVRVWVEIPDEAGGVDPSLLEELMEE